MDYYKVEIESFSANKDSVRHRANLRQCERRAKLARIDYANVSAEANQIIDSQRNGGIDGTASAILNRIVVEWAKSNNIN